ncbi:MAG: mechanosensitive ion channel [Cyclobacteriaceae bacterium]
MDQLYYGNSIYNWLIAFGLILLAFVAGRILYWIFKNTFRKITKRTTSQLDDLLLDNIEEPVVFIAVLFGVRFGVEKLNIAEEYHQIEEYAFAFIITIAFTWMIIRVYNALHETYLVPLAERTHTDLDDHLLPVIKKVLNILVWTLGAIIALNNAGYDVTAVLAGLGIGGLAFALAIQHTFGNIVSGMLIYTDHHIKVGDRIQVKGRWGRIDGVVQEIGMRTTRVKTRYEGRLVSIPNSMLTDQDLINVESEDGRQLFHVFKLAVDTIPEKVELMMEILKEAVKSTEGTKELVVVGLVKVSEISLDIMHLYWVENESSKVKTRNAINLKILRRMQEEDIKFTDRTMQHYNKDVEY